MMCLALFRDARAGSGHCSTRGWFGVFVGLLAFWVAGCGRDFEGKLYMHPNTNTSPLSTNLVGLKLKNPPSGLLFAWKADRGQVFPVMTTNPWATYVAPRDPGLDVVWVTVARRAATLLRDGISVSVCLDPPAGDSPLPPYNIRITEVPPFDPDGGPDSSGELAGEVVGAPEPARFRVVVYAKTDYWYVQPTTAQPLTPIAPSGKWSTWTHLGSNYAALLVKPTYKPPLTARALPGEGGDVLARVVVPGKR